MVVLSFAQSISLWNDSMCSPHGVSFLFFRVSAKCSWTRALIGRCVSPMYFFEQIVLSVRLDPNVVSYTIWLKKGTVSRNCFTYHQLRASACYVGKEGGSLCIVCTQTPHLTAKRRTKGKVKRREIIASAFEQCFPDFHEHSPSRPEDELCKLFFSVIGYSSPRTVLIPHCGKSCTAPGLHTEFLCATLSFITCVDRQAQWQSTQVVKLKVAQRNALCNPNAFFFHSNVRETKIKHAKTLVYDRCCHQNVTLLSFAARLGKRSLVSHASVGSIYRNFTNFRCVKISVATDGRSFGFVKISVSCDAAVIAQCIFFI